MFVIICICLNNKFRASYGRQYIILVTFRLFSSQKQAKAPECGDGREAGKGTASCQIR